MHHHKVLTDKATEIDNCNCPNKDTCLLTNSCQKFIKSTLMEPFLDTNKNVTFVHVEQP